MGSKLVFATYFFVTFITTPILGSRKIDYVSMKDVADENDGLSALQVTQAATRAKLSTETDQMPWMTPPPCACNNYETYNLASSAGPLCQLQSRCSVLGFMGSCPPGGAVCMHLPANLPDCQCSQFQPEVIAGGEGPFCQGSPGAGGRPCYPVGIVGMCTAGLQMCKKPKRLPNCQCKQYRPQGLSQRSGSICQGPAESWGSPCYPFNEHGECNADWTACKHDGGEAPQPPTPLPPAPLPVPSPAPQPSELPSCACQAFRPSKIASSTEPICQGPSENWGNPCYKLNEHGACNADMKMCKLGKIPDEEQEKEEDKQENPKQVEEGVVRPGPGKPGKGKKGDLLERATIAMDDLPNRDAFRSFHPRKLPLTIAIVNDVKSPFVRWIKLDSFEVTDGHKYAAPAVGTKLRKGDMFVIQVYSRSTGSAGKLRLTDNLGNFLSIAFASYQVGNIWGCDALRVEAVRTKSMNEAENDLCHVDGQGLFKLNDYQVLVSAQTAQ